MVKDVQNLYLYSINGFNDISLSMTECNLCNSVSDCISSYWYLYCGYDYTTSTTFYGSSCSSSSLCDCNEFLPS